MTSVKTCPDCKSQVPADAKVCAHCRHAFRDLGDKIIRAFLGVALTIVFIVVGLVVLGAMIGPRR